MREVFLFLIWNAESAKILNWNQGRFPFNKNSGLNFRKFHVPNGTSGTVRSVCTHPTQASARSVIVLVSYCNQDTKEQYWGQQFCQKESDRPKWPWPDWSKRTTFNPGPEYSDGTKPKWYVPFDIPTIISGILGWIESSDARSRIHIKILLPRDLREKGIFKGIWLRKIYARHYRVCFYQSYLFKIPYTKH